MKTLRRVEIPGATYHVIFRTQDPNYSLLGNAADCLASEINLLSDSNIALIHAWVIMPNHVHILVTPEDGKISKVIQRLKGRTSYQLSSQNNKPEKLWKPRYYDRRLRSEKHLPATIEYIVMNPVKAGLCSKPENWRWSSIYQESSTGCLAANASV